MNAYQELQSSGIDWSSSPTARNYELLQAAPRWPESLQRAALAERLRQQMAESVAQDEAALNEVCKHYVLPTDASVRDFLTKHRGIPEILLEATPYLKLHFGGNAVFNLRRPIDEAGSRTLYAVAMWPGELRDVRDALARFDSDWWMPRAGQAAGYLTFTYELV